MPDLPLPELISVETLIAVVTVSLAGIVRGFSGFGSAMVMVPVLAVLYEPVRAVPLALVLEMAVSLPLVPPAARLVDWRRMSVLLIAAAATVPLGVWVLHTADPLVMRFVLSAIVISGVVLLASGWRYRGRPGFAPTLTTGVLAGAMNGMAGMAGPPVVFFYLASSDKAAVSRASFIVFFALLDVVVLAAFAVTDSYDRDGLVLAAVLSVPFVLAALLGARLFSQASERFYRNVALAILSCIAIGTLLV
ncbi:MAG: sulfite exporter TauE/SafE family protein [Reyranellaceae bacterium]